MLTFFPWRSSPSHMHVDNRCYNPRTFSPSRLMKKVLLWIGAVVLALVIVFLIVVALIAAGLIPTSSTGSSLSQNYGFVGESPAREEYKMLDAARAPAMPEWDGASDHAIDVSADERVVIRSARIAIVTGDVQQTVEKLKTYVQENGGFVVNARVESDEREAPAATVSFRIPAEKLDAALAFVREQAMRVASESISGEDVTEEYVDIKARLENLQASEKQLQAIMKDARKTEEVLSVHRELERVRGEIESLTGRKKYFDQAAKMSSVVVTIATDEASIPVVESRDEWRPLVVVKGAVAALLDVLKFLVNVVIWIIIFVPLWGTAWFAVRSWRKRRLST